jgi:CTP synthase (UTP-ammonia lyase)
MRLAIIGDYDENFRPHVATNEAIQHSLDELRLSLTYDWISTESIESNFESITSTFNGYWIAPGSPYKSMTGALKIIKFCREQGIPTLGTCGGFQHMVIEFARNVLKIEDAEHAEYNPYASKLVINPLSCSLAGQLLQIELTNSASKTFATYGAHVIHEKYYCNFGLNPVYQDQLNGRGFNAVGIDTNGEARILELNDHPFFIATLFVPQDNSQKGKPHPLITHFINAIYKQ